MRIYHSGKLQFGGARKVDEILKSGVTDEMIHDVIGHTFLLTQNRMKRDAIALMVNANLPRRFETSGTSGTSGTSAKVPIVSE
jgi:hypothetical protein